jgi:hypothetical protein
MSKFRIPMTDAEEAIVARIDFGEGHGGQRDRHAAYLANREPILELLESLTERRGIPAHRLGYWNDPQFNPGRVKGSRKQMFERHGTAGREIYTHPNFVRHLRYILSSRDRSWRNSRARSAIRNGSRTETRLNWASSRASS